MNNKGSACKNCWKTGQSHNTDCDVTNNVFTNVSYWHEPKSNQNRAQHYYSLLFLPNRAKIDHFFLRTNPRVVNRHVKTF